MKRILITASVITLLAGCKTTPYIAPQNNIDDYFNNIVIKPQSGEVNHPNHGEMLATSEPYALDYDQCQEKVFEGQSFMFGTLKVSDPKKLNQFSFDYLKATVATLFGNKKGSSAAYAGASAAVSVSTGTTPTYNYATTSKSLFRDKSLTDNLKDINKLSSQTLDCVRNKGWSYISKKKTKKQI